MTETVSGCLAGKILQPRGIGGVPRTLGLEDLRNWGAWLAERNKKLEDWGRLADPERPVELLELAYSMTGGAWLSQIGWWSSLNLPTL